MALEPIYDSLEAVPEAVRPFYKEENGKHVIDLAIGNHPGFVGLRNNRDEILGEKKKLTSTLQAFTDRFPNGLEDIDAAIAAAKSSSKDKDFDKDAYFAERLKPLQSEWDRKLKTSAEALEASEAINRKLLITGAVRQYAADIKIDPAWHDDMALRAEQELHIENGIAVAYGTDGKVRYGKDGNPMGAKEWAEEWASKRPGALIPSQGGSAAPGAGAHPGHKQGAKPMTSTELIKAGLQEAGFRK